MIGRSGRAIAFIVRLGWEDDLVQLHDSTSHSWFLASAEFYSELRAERAPGSRIHPDGGPIPMLIDFFQASGPQLADPKIAVLLLSITRESPGDVRTMRWVALEQIVRDNGNRVSHLPPTLQRAIRQIAEAPEYFGQTIPPEWLE
jgi:hypothetical protein